MLWIIIGIAISYLLGSIPCAYIFVKVFKRQDIRDIGSGNVGATNASRILGKELGILVLLLDMLKGFTAVVFLPHLLPLQETNVSLGLISLIFGISAISGHIWTIFLSFKGGKGVATMLGVLFGAALKISGVNLVLLMVLLTWVIVFVISRIISLSSVIAALFLPLFFILFTEGNALVYISMAVSFLIILRHKSNLSRLIKGQEPHFSFKKQ